MPKTNLRILHTSDIHLDDRIGEGEEESPAQRGFKTVINHAIDERVDLFLLAGDLFDHNRVKAPCLEFATTQLARLHCPVLMITGNHDCMADYSVYHRYDPCEAGDHINFIREEEGGLVHLEELDLTIWGRGIVDHHPDHKPLGVLPDANNDGWFIGMTHGYYVGRGAQMFSSLITPEEIEQSPFDYLALGHVHVFNVVEHGGTTAAYPGSPNLAQGAKEITAALVELCPDNGVSVERVVF